MDTVGTWTAVALGILVGLGVGWKAREVTAVAGARWRDWRDTVESVPVLRADAFGALRGAVGGVLGLAVLVALAATVLALSARADADEAPPAPAPSTSAKR